MSKKVFYNALRGVIGSWGDKVRRPNLISDLIENVPS